MYTFGGGDWSSWMSWFWNWLQRQFGYGNF